MKVLHLLQSNRFSGAENVVCQIIAMFADEPAVDMVYCSTDGPVRDELDRRGVKFIPLQKLNISNVKKAIEDCEPDLIHAHDMRATFIASLAVKDTPIVSHIHNNNFNSRGLSVKSIAYFYAALKARSIVWVSKSSYEGYALSKFLSRKSVVLQNVIDLNSLRKRVEEDECEYSYDVIFVGRITDPKDPLRLMDVARCVINLLPDIKIGIVGTGDLENATRAKCTELGLDGNVDFLGYLENPLKILQDSKLLLMTSKWEGLPMVALEALALGVPIVSTPVDGLRDVVLDGVNGFLRDSNAELAECVATIVNDDSLRTSFSNEAVKFARIINDIDSYRSTLKELYVL